MIFILGRKRKYTSIVNDKRDEKSIIKQYEPPQKKINKLNDKSTTHNLLLRKSVPNLSILKSRKEITKSFDSKRIKQVMKNLFQFCNLYHINFIINILIKPCINNYIILKLYSSDSETESDG